MRLYDHTCVALCEGQYLDIWMAEHDDGLSVELYFDMIGRKTAALISASIEAGAVLAPTTRRSSAATARSAGTSGIAFQLNDDLLGIWGPELATGKEPTDVPRKKKTLPVIYAFEHATPTTGPTSPSSTRTAASSGARRGDRGDPRAHRRPRYTRDQARLHRDRALACARCRRDAPAGAARTARGDRPLGISA
jgi:geranylgeranyl pyrophosphate synthase